MHKFLKLFILLVCCIGYSQNNKQIADANDKFNNYSFIDAIKIYESVVESGYRSPELFQRLANSYYFSGQYAKAEKYYHEYFKEEDNVQLEYLYRYSLCLKSKGNFKKADSIMSIFSSQNQQDNRARLFADRADYLEIIQENSGRYKLYEVEINSDYSDYGPFVLHDKLIFTSSRPTRRRPLIDKWSNQPYSSLYTANSNPEGNYINVQVFNENILSDYHESTAVFTKDGKTMYFTSSNIEELEKDEKPENKKLLLNLYKATYDGENWGNIQKLEINNNQSNNAHPALSPDEKFLYFTSDRYPSKGNSDIFRVAIHNHRIIGEPENLGAIINTEGRETFPYISLDNKLYFSSDGHPGLGGLDVFCAEILEDGSLKQPVNVGKPINSEADDFSFIINNTTKIGYFTSNREHEFKSDNIFKIHETSAIPEDFGQHKTIVGVITEKNDTTKIRNADISLYDLQYNHLLSTKTDTEGRYSLGELGYGDYRVIIKKEGHEAVENILKVAKNEPKREALVKSLEKNQIEIGADTNLREILHVSELYFDFNKWDITPKAEANLAKVLVFLQNNLNVNMLIRAHTDSRGDADYNLTISKKRANAVSNWLVSKGIQKNRLQTLGMGESSIINTCVDGVPCTEEEHRINRRIDFMIIE